MEVMSIVFGDNEDTSGEEFSNKESDVEFNKDALKETNHPHFSKFQNWGRSLKNREDSKSAGSQDFSFYLLDCDSWACPDESAIFKPKPSESVSRDGKTAGSELCPLKQAKTTVFRLYGVDEADRSVCCFVRGFKPYFYAAPSNPFTADDLPVFVDSLNLAIILELKQKPRLRYLLEHLGDMEPVISAEIVTEEYGENILGYHLPKLSPPMRPHIILKVTCMLTVFIRIATQVLRQGKVACPFIDHPCTYDVYETNLNPVVRFLTSKNISCCSWVDVKEGWREGMGEEKQSYADVELRIESDQLVNTNEEKLVTRGIPKLRILSFDIECMTRPPDFVMPHKGNEQVIQISSVLRVYGDDDAPTVQVVFTLDTCEPLSDAEVLSFEDEKSLLESWRLFVILTDPDVLTGYNINRFDIPFLLERAKRLDVQKFPFIGRLINAPATYRSVKDIAVTKYIDPYAETVPYVRGRVIFDMLPVIRHNFPSEGSFKLDYISKRFLDCQKGDVHHTEIFELQTMNAASRSRLAKYCLQDAWLASQLLFRKSGDQSEEPNPDFIQHYCEKAGSSGSPLRYVVSKNGTYDTYFKTLRKFKNPDVVFQAVTPIPRKRIANIPVSRLNKVRRSLFQENETDDAPVSSS